MMEKRFLRFLFKVDEENNKLTGDVKILIEKILDRKISDIKVASVLTCLKYKKSAVLYGKALDVLRKRLERNDLFIPDSIEVSYPYRLKRTTPYFMVAASLVLSLLPKSDIKTVFHGDSFPKRSIKDLFDYLNLTVLSIYDSENMLRNLNITFFNRSLLLPELSDLNRLREEININDIFYYIERFINPVGSMYSLSGSVSESEMFFYRDLLRNRYKRSVLILNTEGYPDIYGKTVLLLLEGEREKFVEVNHKNLKSFKFRGFLTPKKHADFIKNLLEKNIPEYEPLLFLNGAVLLLLRGVTESIEDGYEITESLFKSYDFGQILRNIQNYSDYLNYKNIYEI
ncbi:hypothetical protein [Persephonella sp.]